MNQEHIDELLEVCWVIHEKKLFDGATMESIEKELNSHNEKQESCAAKFDLESALQEAEKNGLINRNNGGFQFTEQGKSRASDIMRRHRLAETLFTDVLELPDAHAESAACKLEHIISEEVTDSVCSFLGHPPLCPHGKPIPRGNCCSKFITTIKPIVTPLADLSPGEEGSIVFISSLHQQRLAKLSSIGIIPGTRVQLNQKLPSYVIKLDEKQIALDKAIVSEIYVRKGSV